MVQVHVSFHSRRERHEFKTGPPREEIAAGWEYHYSVRVRCEVVHLSRGPAIASVVLHVSNVVSGPYRA